MLVFAIAPLKLHVPFLMHSYFIYNAAVIADKALCVCGSLVTMHHVCVMNTLRIDALCLLDHTI